MSLTKPWSLEQEGLAVEIRMKILNLRIERSLIFFAQSESTLDRRMG